MITDLLFFLMKCCRLILQSDTRELEKKSEAMGPPGFRSYWDIEYRGLELARRMGIYLL